MLIGQLLHHVPHASKQFSALKARLSDFAHACCGNPINISDFLILKECIQACRSLRCNKNIHVTKPDKDSGVAILNKSDYISKMYFFCKTTLNLKILALLPKLTTLRRLKLILKDSCFNLRKKAFFHPKFTAGFDQLVRNGPEGMVGRKFTSKMYSYVLYCQ